MKVESSLTEELKWEPVLVIAPYHTLQDKQKNELFQTFTDDELREEFAVIVNTAKDEHVLFVVIAYDGDDNFLGWSVINAWQGQVESKGILLSILTHHVASEEADFIRLMTVEKALQHSKDLHYHDTIKNVKTIYCQRNMPAIEELIKAYQYEPSPVF